MKTTDKNIFLDTAWDIGCQLMRTAIWHNESCNWQGYSVEHLDGTFQPIMRTFGSDVYSGTSGIALFLSALYSERNDPILLKTIEGCISQMKSGMQDSPNYGFYAGKPGIASAIIKIGQELKRQEWIEDGLNLLNSVPCSALQSYELDVISGTAGTIPVLIDAYKLFGKQELLDKAVAMGHLMCQAAIKDNEAWSWATVPSKTNLTGYSHGAAGIAVALLQLYELTGEPIFYEGAQGGFNYERKSFDETQQNWPDFRDGVTTSAEKVCGLAWCHGAPGITLSRLKAMQIKEDPVIQSELDVALGTTVRNIYQNLMDNMGNTNYSLCHGIAGNADILLDCGNVDEYHQLAEAVGLAGILKYKKHNIAWPSGLNTGHYAPGLMMGIAGTGYFYLRLYNKEKHKTLLIPSLN